MPDTTAVPPPSSTVDDELPSEIRIEPRTFFLGGLFALATLAACYAAAEIILPVVLAFVLNLVFQPLLRLLVRVKVPQPLAALLIVLSLAAVSVGLGYLLSGPVSEWIANLPQTLPKLQQKLSFLSSAVKPLQNALQRVENITPTGAPPAAVPVAVQQSTLPQRILTDIRMLAGGAFTMVLVLFFLLVAGDRFLRRLVEILPRFQSKRQAVEISQQIEHDLSAYLATITVMNLLVGIATGLMTWACGLGDALLWGAVAFLLNYVPVLGPTAGVMLFLVVGLVSMDTPWTALLPPALYLLIHVCEGETITPMLLARRFTINPVLVILSLIFWYWMWGVAGAVLSTPMLAITKIICDRMERLKPFGHFIEG